MEKAERRRREGAGSGAAAVLGDCGPAESRLRSLQPPWRSGGVRQPPFPGRCAPAETTASKAPSSCMGFCWAAAKTGRAPPYPAELHHNHVFYRAPQPPRADGEILAGEMMLRARQFPCPIHRTIPPPAVEHPDSSHGKSHSSAEGFAGGHDALRSQPGFSRAHNGDSWVRVWGQGDGNRQGQSAGEGRGAERRWAAGSETSGAELLSSCNPSISKKLWVFFPLGALRSPSALPGRCHITLWVLEMLLQQSPSASSNGTPITDSALELPQAWRRHFQTRNLSQVPPSKCKEDANNGCK